MIKTLIGFILGVVATYYTYPYFGSHFNDASQQLSAALNNGYSNNSLSSISSVQSKMVADNKLNVELMTAISVIKTRKLSDPTSDHTVKLISKLVDKEPGIQTFVRAKLVNGLSNKEALEIFEQYYSVQG